MRSFEERKAEILRISENRIKQRKRNRNRIIALFLPLCIIAVIFSVNILPTVLPVKKDSAYEEYTVEYDNSINDEESLDTKHIYVTVEVKSNDTASGFYSKITDSQAVTNVYENICYMFEPDEAEDFEYSDDNKGAIKGDSSTGGGLQDFNYTPKPVGHTITLTAANGSKRIYTLYDDVLTDVYFNRKIILTDIQLKKLKSALGITK